MRVEACVARYGNAQPALLSLLPCYGPTPTNPHACVYILRAVER